MSARILIAINDAIDARDIARGLKQRGYDRIEIVSTAEEAIKAARDHPPDLILMDIQLHGGADGIEAASQIGSASGIPLIFLTDQLDEPTVERAKTARPHGYLLKPVNETELTTAIGMALNKAGSQSTPPDIAPDSPLGARDMTGNRQAEAAAEQLNANLERRMAEQAREIARLKQELDAFTYSVAHDLRAPLRGIMGYLDAFREDHAQEIPPQALGYLQRGIECAARMQALMDDLLKLSRIGRQELQCASTPVNRIATEVIAELVAENPHRQIEWRVSDLPTVVCDPAMTRRVFANLLSNAVKYTRRQPRAIIEVFHEKRDSEHVIVIRDNGVGFEMQRARSLFTPFFRMHAEQEFEGTGVGLAIVERIVRRHGGRIWAEGKVGGGATFYFTLGGDHETSRLDEQRVGHDPIP